MYYIKHDILKQEGKVKIKVSITEPCPILHQIHNEKAACVIASRLVDDSSVLLRMVGTCFTFLPMNTLFRANTISGVRSKKPIFRFQLIPHLQCCKPGNCCFFFLPQLGQTLLLAPISVNLLELVQPQLALQLVLGRQIGEVFGCEDLIVAFREGVFYDGIALISAEDNTDGRIVTLIH